MVGGGGRGCRGGHRGDRGAWPRARTAEHHRGRDAARGGQLGCRRLHQFARAGWTHGARPMTRRAIPAIVASTLVLAATAGVFDRAGADTSSASAARLVARMREAPRSLVFSG